MASRIGDSRSRICPTIRPRGLPSTPSSSAAIPVIHRVALSHFCVLYRLCCFFVVTYELAPPFHIASPKHISPETDNTMSSSIAIPKRKQPVSSGSGFASASSSSASPYPSWANNAASPSFSRSSLALTSASPSSASTPSSMARYAERRPSLLGMSATDLLESIVTDECIGDSLSKSEYTVVNIGGPENPRLVSNIKVASQACINADVLYRSHASRHLKASTGTRVCTVNFHP